MKLKSDLSVFSKMANSKEKKIGRATGQNRNIIKINLNLNSFRHGEYPLKCMG
jgi:hypothetical protein